MAPFSDFGSFSGSSGTNGPTVWRVVSLKTLGSGVGVGGALGIDVAPLVGIDVGGDSEVGVGGCVGVTVGGAAGVGAFVGVAVLAGTAGRVDAGVDRGIGVAVGADSVPQAVKASTSKRTNTLLIPATLCDSLVICHFFVWNLHSC